MGFKIPSALAGDDNEIEMNEEGMRTVVQYVGGVAGGLGILAAGAYIYRYVAGIAGASKDVGSLY